MAKILLIEDEELVRLTIRQTLESAGHEVIEAANGRIGVAVYKENPADLVITDIIMPEQEGVETIIKLRQENPDLPILAMSGGGRMGNTDFLQHAKKFGARHVFAKPFDRQEFLAVVESTLGEHC